MSFKIGIIGATGVVGRLFLEYIEKSSLEPDEITLYASKRSEGKVINYKDYSLRIIPLAKESLKQFDYAFFSAGSEISREFIPILNQRGTICIDNSSYFRMHKDVPIIVPFVNDEKLSADFRIIANPNCVVAGIVVAAAPLHRLFKINRIIASTYQSVSGAGKKAIDELNNRVRSYVFKDKLTKPEIFDKDILFNVLCKIPHTKQLPKNDYTEEEKKVMEEIPKILDDQTIKVTATCVRVPVFIGHSVSLNISLEKKASVEEIEYALSKAQGLKLITDDYTTPLDVAGKEDVYVSRIRKDNSAENSFWLWINCDNLRKGAAYNAFQILERLIDINSQRSR